MNNVIFRSASAGDALAVAKLAILAGGGIFEFLLEDFVKDISLENLLALEVKKERGNLSYIHTEVAELNGKIIGVIKSSAPQEPSLVKEIKDSLHPDKIDWLKDLFLNLTDERIYNNSFSVGLSVDVDFQNQGIGTELIARVKNKAQNNNISRLNLTVWADNLTAIEFYKNQGFEEVKHINIAFHPLMPHHEGIKLMQCLMDS